MSGGIHRLFVGLPVEGIGAEQIHRWAAENYGSLPVKLTVPEQLHATLLFFPKVSSGQLEEMAELVGRVEWQTFSARTNETVRMGRDALTLCLDLPEEQRSRLDDRLVQSNCLTTESEYHDKLRQEPLGLLALKMDRPEWSPRLRDQRHGRALQMHVTFARVRKHVRDEIPIVEMPPVDVSLARIVLYESHLGAEGTRYEILAESVAHA